MADIVRVGLVGASAAGSGWSSVAHIPALHAAEGIELAAVCTSRPESAAAAGKAYGVRSFHDVRDLAAQQDIDAISVVVRVPKHHELVAAALDAGKHVFSEWPLGANLAEAQEMAAGARRARVVTAVGLQGRHDPSLTYIRQLHAEGWFGQIVAVNAAMMGGGALAHSSADAWMGVKANGANFMTIVGGHTIDAISYCLDAFTELSASVATQVPNWRLSDTGETIPVDAPDSLIVNGVLVGGAMVSLHAASVPHNAPGWRMEIYGTEGTAVASTSGLPQITPITLSGARGSEPLRELALPAGLTDRFPAGPPGNVGRAYQHMAEAIKAGQSFSPDFAHAESVHKLLDLIEQSSAEGTSLSVS
jgi:predicted dehydrogenase